MDRAIQAIENNDTTDFGLFCAMMRNREIILDQEDTDILLDALVYHTRGDLLLDFLSSSDPKRIIDHESSLFETDYLADCLCMEPMKYYIEHYLSKQELPNLFNYSKKIGFKDLTDYIQSQ